MVTVTGRALKFVPQIHKFNVQMKLKTTEFVPGTGPQSGPKLEVQIALGSCKKWQKARLVLVLLLQDSLFSR